MRPRAPSARPGRQGLGQLRFFPSCRLRRTRVKLQGVRRPPTCGPAAGRAARALVRGTEWRYHHVEAGEVAGIDFDKYGRNGFELCGLASRNGKLVAAAPPPGREMAGCSCRPTGKGGYRFLRICDFPLLGCEMP